jgi:hypothetical protein
VSPQGLGAGRQRSRLCLATKAVTQDLLAADTATKSIVSMENIGSPSNMHYRYAATFVLCSAHLEVCMTQPSAQPLLKDGHRDLPAQALPSCASGSLNRKYHV